MRMLHVQFASNLQEEVEHATLIGMASQHPLLHRPSDMYSRGDRRRDGLADRKSVV